MNVTLEVQRITDTRLVSTLGVLAVFTLFAVLTFITSIILYYKNHFVDRQDHLVRRVQQQKQLRSDALATVLVAKMKRKLEINKNGQDNCDARAMPLNHVNQQNGDNVIEGISCDVDPEGRAEENLGSAGGPHDDLLAVTMRPDLDAEVEDKSHLYYWLIVLGKFGY
jgi:plasmid maintenance system killer protein